MTPDEKQDLGGYIAARLRGGSKRLDPVLAEMLEQRTTPLFIAVRSRGRRLREFWLEGESQLTALGEGLAQIREQLGHVKGAVSLEVCLTHDFQVVNSASDQEWRAANYGVTRGVLGVELAYQGLIDRVGPTTMIATNRNLERLLQLFAEKHSIRPEHVRGAVRITRFAADQLLILFDRKPRTIPLVRGARLVQPNEVNRTNTLALADLLGGFLAGQVHDDGRMTYLYYPSRGSEEEDRSINNMIRQWMATLALCRFARAKNDDTLRELADKNIRYNLEQYYRRQAGLGLIEFREHVKLGAVALAVLSVMEHAKREDYAEVEASLWRTLDHQWQESGEFRTFVFPADRNDQTNFYPGEALLAWAHRYRETRDPALLERFMRSFRYYRRWHLDPKHRNPAFIPWHTQAYFIVHEVTGDQELAEFIFEMNDWLVPFQQWPTPAHPDFAGRFYDPQKPYGPPHASSTGVYMEGLIDAFELAGKLGQETRQRRYARTISRGIRSLMQLTYRDEADLYYSSAPERLLGGVRTTCYDNVIRIDNVQHNLLALLKIVTQFDDQDYDTESTDHGSIPEPYTATPLVETKNLRTLYGPNLLANTSQICAEVRLRRDIAPRTGFAERFGWIVSHLKENFQRGPTPSAPTRDVPSSDELARLVGELAAALQQGVGFAGGPPSVHPGESADWSTVAVGFEYEELGTQALQLATFIVATALEARDDWQSRILARLDNLRRFSVSLPGEQRREIARRARALGIPCERIAQGPTILRLGQGNRQKLCELTVTSETSLAHSRLVSNKPEAGPFFIRHGVPMPRQRVAGSEREAVAAAEELGYPVVTKPWRGSGGRGVSANLRNESEVRAGYARARAFQGRRVLLEQYLPGDDYRFLLLHGELVAVTKRLPPHVVGDGSLTVAELVSKLNHERQRDDGLPETLKAYKIDDDSLRMLADAGLEVDSVPERGRTVYLSSAANGGTTEDIDLSTVHPDNKAAACHAARVGGIDVCGIDFLLPDPSRSYRETGGGICEVNFQPSLLLHMIADGGRSVAMVDRFLRALIPDKDHGRIPVTLMAGAETEVGDAVARLLGERGVARADERGVFLGDYQVANGQTLWPNACHMALYDPATEQALLALDPEHVARHGLCLDRCRLLVWASPKQSVTPADQLALERADSVVRWDTTEWSNPAPQQTIVCSVDPASTALLSHVEHGGRAVVLETDGRIVARAQNSEILVGRAPSSGAPSTNTLLLAVAASWVLRGDIAVVKDAFASAWESQEAT